MLQLFLLFTLLPALELWLLMQIGSVIGGAETILLIIVTGVIGASMAKREGLSVLMQIQQEAKRGSPPGDALIEGFLILIGGVLLVTPGVLTDFFGFSLIFPLTRRLLAPAIRKAAMNRQGASLGGASWNLHVGAPRPRHTNDEHYSASNPEDPAILSDGEPTGSESKKSPFKHPVR